MPSFSSRQKRGVTLLESAAIQRNSRATYVFLIKPDQTVTVRNVGLGTTDGENTEITSGLNPGDPVVMTGVDRLQEGSKVTAHFEEADHHPPRAAPPGRRALNESLPDFYSSSGCYFASDGGHSARRHCCLQAASGFRFARSRLSDDPDHTRSIRGQPDVMASSVTAPLERQFGQVPGLQQMTSTSSDGEFVITLQFTLSLNIDIAEQEVQAAINASATFLPVTCRSRRFTARQIRRTHPS